MVTVSITPAGSDSNYLLLSERKKHKKVNKVVEDFYPYFYISDINHPFLRREKAKKIICSNLERLIQLRNEFSGKYFLYEADIPYNLRYAIDNSLDFNFKDNKEYLKFAFIDLEVLINNSIFDKILAGENKITAISAFYPYQDELYFFTAEEADLDKVKSLLEETFNKAKEQDSNLDLNVKYHFYSCSSEEEMLFKFQEKVINSLDIFSGWNTPFDFKVLRNRIDYLGLDISLSNKEFNDFKASYQERGDAIRFFTPGYTVLDFLETYKRRMIKLEENYTLDYITRKWNLIIPKFQHNYPNLDALLFNDPELYCYYNIIDTITLKLLEEKCNYIEISFILSEICSCPLEYVNSMKMLIDSYILKRLKKLNRLRITRRENFNNLTGGYVYAKKGAHLDYIIDLDFTSLYPFIIMNLNISPETYLTEADKLEKAEDLIIAENQAVFTKKEGFIPGIIKELFSLRKEYKRRYKEKLLEYQKTKDLNTQIEAKKLYNYQWAIKTLLNSIYGVLGDKTYSLCYKKLAEAVTLTGQFLIRSLKRFIEQQLSPRIEKQYHISLEVIYIDTDSNFIKLKNCPSQEVAFEVTKIINQEVDKFLKELSQEKNYLGSFQVKTEIIANAMLIKEKKKYALNILYNEAATERILSTEDYKELNLTPLNEIEVKGLDLIRKDAPNIVKDFLQDFLNTLLINQDLDAAIDLLFSIRRYLNRNLYIPARINKLVKNEKTIAYLLYNFSHTEEIILRERFLYAPGIGDFNVTKINQEITAPVLKRKFYLYLRNRAEDYLRLLLFN